MKRVSHIIIAFVALFGASEVMAQSVAPENRVPLADPYILLHEGTYYAYGTHHRDGIECYISNDLKSWYNGGLVLHKNDSYGKKWFWAPEVYHINGKFYMYYTAQERICAAIGDSPVGPFKQVEKVPMLPDMHTIDNTLFIDDDGTPYIFYVHIKNGFHIKMAELESDLITIKKSTIKTCFTPRQKWESLSKTKVNEGPSVIKHKGIYYILYSGNGYTNHRYGIGYATATNIRGPWKKSDSNPILQFPGELVGSGHGAPFYDKKGKLHYVFHAHYSHDRVHPRCMYISRAAFKRGDKKVEELVISDKYFTPKTK